MLDTALTFFALIFRGYAPGTSVIVVRQYGVSLFTVSAPIGVLQTA